MDTFVIAAYEDGVLSPATFSVITAARELSEEVTVLVVGEHANMAAMELAKRQGVTRVLLVDDPLYAHVLPENMAVLIAELAKDADAILAPATTFGKNILPRVAALLDTAALSDVTRIVSADIFEHPIYAGNVIETVRVLETKKIMTIRSTAFSPAAISEQSAPIERIQKCVENKQSFFVAMEKSTSTRPELTRADIVVSGGRGLQSAAQFKLIEQLADKLGAAVGASRAAVDAGFVPNDYQVGQTGKIVAPKLYIAIGISGAIQHLAGMKDAKVIVAINKDEEAPIMQLADYYLVGDLFTLVPEWIEKL